MKALMKSRTADCLGVSPSILFFFKPLHYLGNSLVRNAATLRGLCFCHTAQNKPYRWIGRILLRQFEPNLLRPYRLRWSKLFSPEANVLLGMTMRAQPNHIKRARIIGMVAMPFALPALTAQLGNYQAVSYSFAESIPCCELFGWSSVH